MAIHKIKTKLILDPDIQIMPNGRCRLPDDAAASEGGGVGEEGSTSRLRLKIGLDSLHNKKSSSSPLFMFWPRYNEITINKSVT